MTEQLDLEDWLREHPRQYPRHNGKSTLALNCIRLQEEVNEANYKTYAERVKNDLLRKENQQLKDVISKMCMELVDPDDDMSNGLAEYFNQDLLLEIHEVLK